MRELFLVIRLLDVELLSNYVVKLDFVEILQLCDCIVIKDNHFSQVFNAEFCQSTLLLWHFLDGWHLVATDHEHEYTRVHFCGYRRQIILELVVR